MSTAGEKTIAIPLDLLINTQQACRGRPKQREVTPAALVNTHAPSREVYFNSMKKEVFL
jgi:hypothetical protein